MDDVENYVWTAGGDFVGRDVHIHGDLVRGDKVLGDKIIYQGPAYPRPDYRGEIADILAHYTHTFVGREREWAELTRFVGQEVPGYTLVEAPAGYGKTALMAHVIQRHEAGRWESGPSPRLLYFFIRQEGGRHTPEAFLQALNAQLLALLDQSGGVPPDLISLRGQFSQLWARAVDQAGENRPVLMLVDGLDELAPGEVTIAHLLPADLAPYVHVVVTSRPNPEPLAQVVLTHPFKKAHELSLHAFGEVEIHALLREYGAAPDVASSLTPRVLAVTKGEPLFARFVCQEAADKGEMALARLEQNPPADVEAYFRQQFRQLDSLAEGDLAWEILGLLVVTLGGITLGEIAEVLGKNKRQVRKALEPIQRFLLGQDRLELMHLQLRKAVAGEFSPSEQSAHRDKLLDWCRSYQEQGWPTQTPDYILAHYARHLVEAGQPDALYTLIDKRWMNVKFERTYSHRAFAEDVERAIKMAEAEEPSNLVQIVRNCLIYATLGSQATEVRPEVLGVLVQSAKAGQVIQILAKVQGYAALIQDPNQQSDSYRMIGEALLRQGEIDLAKRLFGQALAVSKASGDSEPSKTVALSKVTMALAQAEMKAEATRAGQDTLDAAKGFEGRLSGYVSDALEGVAWASGRMGDMQALERVLAAAKEIGFRYPFEAEALSKAAKGLAEAQMKEEAFQTAQRALGAAQSIWGWENEGTKANALGDVAQVLAEVGDNEGPEQVLKALKQIGDEERKAQPMSDVAKALAQLGQSTLAFEALEEIRVDRYKPRALIEVAQALAQAHLREEAVRAAQLAREYLGDWPEGFKAAHLSKVAEVLAQAGTKEEAAQVAQLALADVKADTTGEMKAQTLGGLIRTFAQVGQKYDLEQALAAMNTITDERFRARALSEAAHTLHRAGMYQEVTRMAQQIIAAAKVSRLGRSSAFALSEVAQAFAQAEMWEEAMNAAQQALDAASAAQYTTRQAALSGVAYALAQTGRKKNLERALKVAKASQHELHKANALSGIAQALAYAGKKKGLDCVLSEVKEIEHPGCKVDALSDVARAMAHVRDKAGLERALDVAKGINDTRWGGYVTEHKIAMLSQVARALAQAEMKELAAEATAEALTAMGSLTWGSLAERLGELAQALAQAGNKEEAVKRAQLALARAEEFEAKDEMKYKAGALGAAAQALAQVGDKKGLEQVLKNTEDFWPEECKGKALSGVAEALAKVGDRAGLERVLAAAAEMRSESPQAEALAGAARAMARIGETKALARALVAAKKIKYGPAKVEALGDIAQALIQVGEKEKAKEAAYLALVAAEVIQEESDEVSALGKVAQALAQLGDINGLEMTLEAAKEIAHAGARASAMSRVAQAFTQIEQRDWGLSIFLMAFKVSQLAGPRSVIQVLEQAASALAAIDRGETLWGIYEAVMEVESWWSDSGSK